MRFILILITFIISVYVFPSYYVFFDLHIPIYYTQNIDEDCEICMDMFSVVKAVSKAIRFLNLYNSVIIYLAISFIFFVKIRKKIFYFTNNPTGLKVKLIN